MTIATTENGKIVIRHGIEAVHLDPVAAWKLATEILEAVQRLQFVGYTPTNPTPKNWAPETGTGAERL